MGKAGEESVSWIGLAFDRALGCICGEQCGKGVGDAITADFAEGDFDDLGEGVAVENGGDGIADIDHEHAEAAVVFIGAGASLVGVFAGAADGGEAAVHEADDVADADLRCVFGKEVAAGFPAACVNQAGLTEFLEDAFDEFHGKPVCFREVGTCYGGQSQLVGDSQMDGGAQGVFGFF